MTSEAFRDRYYFTENTTRRIRVEDLKKERDSQLDAIANAASWEEVLKYQGSIALLNELIDVLEKGIAAPAPDAGISDVS